VQLPATTNVEDFFIIDKEVVIQDYNSQQVLNFLKDEAIQNGFSGKSKHVIAAWDCCAASGGKSILLTDIFHNKIDLTISDIRASIVLNLHLRFKRAGIKEYKYFISDISQADFTPVASDFDLVICDAPCTGSGTWSRTPEQLCFFKEQSITEYSNLQQKIITHVLPHLQTGGMFIYITCSVFKQENEMIAAFIQEKFNCKLRHQQLLEGYNRKADSMFVAVFEKL
jgi:16S rRNA (cytosine967-C5)-methyltransferase